MVNSDRSRVQAEKERERFIDVTNKNNKYYSDKADIYYKEDSNFDSYDRRGSFEKNQYGKEKLSERESYNDRMKDYVENEVFDDRVR